MKQFLLGILATVVAGVVLFLAQSYISEYRNGQGPRLEYSEFAPSFYFSAAKAAEWQKSIPSTKDDVFAGQDRLAAEAIIIENKGDKPIQDQRVIIKPKYVDNVTAGVIYAENDVIPGTDELGTNMKVINGSLIVDYKLLDVGEMHRFWIVKDRYADLAFVIRKPGLDVTGWTAKIYRQPDKKDWTFLVFFGAIAIAVISLLAGALLVASNAKKIAAAYDIDPEKFFVDGPKLVQKRKAQLDEQKE